MSHASASYDLLVIGGGHAGAEAAWAAANLGARVALVTLDPTKIGQMSCNPAIGGLAKGQIVREIDALGGLMGLAADATGIQFRVLNRSKGPAVRGPRCQSDKYAYAVEVQRLLRTRPNIDILTASVERIAVDHGRVTGAFYRDTAGEVYRLDVPAIVLTTGTFMRGLMHTGDRQTPGGRVGEAAANTISDSLRELGFELGRLKTGTPPRLAAQTIDFAALDEQWGDQPPVPFSELTLCDGAARGSPFPPLEQRCCWITHTTGAIHDAIRANLDRAPLFNGQIHQGSVGPRYCPSIEDKVVRFADKPSHHVFLEPESLSTNEIYCNGISTSLPADIQNFIVAHLPGCEHARVLRYGYAVEYDMVWPHQIDATTMTKRVAGLFLAGQINGTSGYEEAAAQGLIAGLNAVRYVRGQSLVRLRRDQAYIGVLLDDLVTRTPREPYRMFTSRAEHRLMLRADNADARLTPLGRELGLVDDHRWQIYTDKQTSLAALRDYLAAHKHDGRRLLDLARQPQADAQWVRARLNGDPLPPRARDLQVIDALLSDLLYAGYLDRQQRDIDKLAEQEERLLPPQIEYDRVTGLRNEAKHVLGRFRPATFGQAARLAGITPADMMVLAVTMERGPIDE